MVISNNARIWFTCLCLAIQYENRVIENSTELSTISDIHMKTTPENNVSRELFANSNYSSFTKEYANITKINLTSNAPNCCMCQNNDSKPQVSGTRHMSVSQNENASENVITTTGQTYSSTLIQQETEFIRGGLEENSSSNESFLDHIDLDKPTSAIIKKVSELVCVYTGLCKMGLGSRLQACDLTCECHCEDDCSVFGDCCPDKNDNVPRPPIHWPQYASCFEPHWMSLGHGRRAVIVDRCPAEYNDQVEDSRKCEKADHTIQIQATPVSDPSTQVSFKNVYCARCHGVKNAVDWTHKVSCRTEKHFEVKTREEIWPALTQGSIDCKIVAFPPSDQSLHRCYPTVIDKCNVSGKWVQEDWRIESLCLEYTHVVQYNSTEFYRNTFCAVCNGIDIKLAECKLETYFPFSLSVLLDVTPVESSAVNHQRRDAQTVGQCRSNQTWNPFNKCCEVLQCHQRQVFIFGKCQPIFTSAVGLGFTVDVRLEGKKGSVASIDENVLFQYFVSVHMDYFLNFQDLYLLKMLQMWRPRQRPNTANPSDVDVLYVHLEIIVGLEESLSTTESKLHDTVSSAVYLGPNKVMFNALLLSCPPSRENVPEHDTFEIQASNLPVTLLTTLCKTGLACFENVHFAPLLATPDCLFVEFNLSMSTFYYDLLASDLIYGDFTFPVNRSRIHICGEIMLMCSDVLEEISSFLSQHVIQSDTQAHDTVLTIVSFVCLCLSLLGLLMTFVVYAILPQLRTLPGKITMILVLHLFVAQLFFLVGSNWTSNPVICKAMAVLIHYFWLTTFAWMMMSAYHMYSMFINYWAFSVIDKKETNKTLSYYSISCLVIPAIVVTCCIAYHYVSSQHLNIGYGANVCFLNTAVGLWIFFAVPVAIMLLFNVVCFVRTVVEIHKVSEEVRTTRSTNRRYVLIYFKLSLLFGFSWAAGLLRTVIKSIVLDYVFVTLTGSQGIFICIAYCMCKRVLNLLKDKFRMASSS